MKKIILFFALIIALNFCSKKENNNTNVDSKTTDSIQTQLDNFKPSIPVTKIKQLDIASFVTIYSSFLEDQIIWLRDNYKSNNNINSESEEDLTQDSEDFLKQQAAEKENFFKQWGITFLDFDQFSLTHSQEIQEYLKSHSTEQNNIEKLEEFLSSIQNSNPVQNDEYNFKDENIIVEKATEQEKNFKKENKETIQNNNIPDTEENNNPEGDL